jgi:hypothetical protein
VYERLYRYSVYERLYRYSVYERLYRYSVYERLYRYSVYSAWLYSSVRATVSASALDHLLLSLLNSLSYKKPKARNKRPLKCW